MFKKLFKKQKFIMLIGLPVSGKTSYGKYLQNKKNTVTISQDIVRESLIELGKLTEDNIWTKEGKRLVGKATQDTVIKLLKSGFNVCYDATNLVSSYRKEMLNKINEYNPNIIKYAYVFTSNGYCCINRNSKRENPVPVNVIRQMAMTFEIPSYDEGWNGIKSISWEEIKKAGMINE